MLLLQPTLTLDKDSFSQEKPSQPSRQPKKRHKPIVEPELSESDEYVDFTESRHNNTITEFTSVIVGEETETSSAVQSIQQVHMQIYTQLNHVICHVKVTVVKSVFKTLW